MQKELQKVAEFHQKITVPIGVNPSFISHKRTHLRYDTIREELEEYFEEAQASQSLANLAKELVDLSYAVYETIFEHGLQERVDAIFHEVHCSNMFRDPSSGKAIKKNYKPADVEQFFGD